MRLKAFFLSIYRFCQNVLVGVEAAKALKGNQPPLIWLDDEFAHLSHSKEIIKYWMTGKIPFQHLFEINVVTVNPRLEVDPYSIRSWTLEANIFPLLATKYHFL